jgi:hypothetical protein
LSKYCGFLNSSVYPQSDNKGTIVTTTSPQTFQMIDPVAKLIYSITNIQLDADASNDIKIKFNSDASFEYIVAGGNLSIEDLVISSITCVSPVGTKFSFKALADAVYGR